MTRGDVAKSVAGSVSGLSIGVTAPLTLPPETPWWGYLLAYFLSAAVTAASVYFPSRQG
ncbi:hypothetical protein [Zavarzinia sp. CC-PAN008]|uniref:hypothetical protein n=1 Tax=Zavarzinia sp. CC-PAN008 TaxID=3243332 RepID=UPI003F746493